MSHRDSGWPLYVSTALVSILGLWALYLWQRRLDSDDNRQLSVARSVAGREGETPQSRSRHRIAPPVRLTELRSASEAERLRVDKLVGVDRVAAVPSVPDPRRPRHLGPIDPTAAPSRDTAIAQTTPDSAPSARDESNAPDPWSLAETPTTPQLDPPSLPDDTTLPQRPAGNPQPARVPRLIAGLGAPVRPQANDNSDPASDQSASGNSGPFRTAGAVRSIGDDDPRGNGATPDPFRPVGLEPNDSVNAFEPSDVDAGTSSSAPLGSERTNADDRRSDATRIVPEFASVRRSIERLRAHQVVGPYLDRIVAAIDRVERLESLDGPAADSALAELKSAIVPAPSLSEQVDLDVWARIGELQFDLTKRLEILQRIKTLPSDRGAFRSASHSSSGSAAAARCLSAIDATSRELTAAGQELGWSDYLRLTELRAALDDGVIDDTDRALFRSVLRRTVSSRLDDSQRTFLESPLVLPLVETLRTELPEPPSRERLLERLEQVDGTVSPESERELAAAIETLLWSVDDARADLGDHLETNYRNANLRVTLSEAMINRLIPEGMTTEEPVEDRLLGARIIGTSQTQNELRVNLIPDEQQWVMGIEAHGTVSSRTRALKDGFIFHNAGIARFEASKRLALGRHGVDLHDATAQATSSQRTTDVESHLDGLPLIGNIARAIAVQQKNEQEPIARRLVEEKVARTASQRMDDEIRTRMGTARRRLQTEVVEPLHDLGLEPQPIALQTTESRLVLRYRVAGFDQLAATTPRPQALESSLVSFQLHESLINNFVDSLDLGGRRFEPAELADHLSKKLGRPIAFRQAEQQVAFVFPETGALRVRFDDGIVRIRLRLEAIELDGRTWRGIEAEAEYLPSVDACQLRLTRAPDRAVTLIGDRLRLRDQFPLRGIMNTLFDPDQMIDVIPGEIAGDQRLAGTAIGQLVIENGWVGVSIVDTAGQPISPETRSVGLLERLRPFR
ncbi:MAG TPA: hypothetical protein PLI18_01395 [Pirellulaceae bacterium]|nr:hypothetical protein [Pirellulaceae bacterium]